jgi:hypothetical protein
MVRRWVEEGAKASLAKTAPSAWGQGYLFETLQVTLVLQAGLAGTNIYSHAGEILALQSVLGGGINFPLSPREVSQELPPFP